MSKIQLGSSGYVGRSISTASLTSWHYFTILQNRYVLELVMTNKDFHELADFENYITDYLMQVNQANLKK